MLGGHQRLENTFGALSFLFFLFFFFVKVSCVVIDEYNNFYYLKCLVSEESTVLCESGDCS